MAICSFAGKHDLSTSKIHFEIQDKGVLMGLEIYDGPKFLNCNLYFVIVRGVSRKKAYSHLSVGGGCN